MEYIVDMHTIREINIDPETLRKDRKVTITNFDITGKVTTSIIIYERGITQSPLFS